MSRFLGYARPDGSVGVRNHVMVLPSVGCSATVARRIAAAAPGAVCVWHQAGCAQVGEDHEQTVRVLAGLVRHGNVAATLLVGLGCEGATPEKIVAAAGETGRPLEAIGIQDLGGSRRAIEEGISIARRLAQAAAAQEREACPMEKLIVGTECGGSDAWSGLSANPAVGGCSDLFVAAGAAVILAETTEMIGAEHLLERRAEAPEVGSRLRAAIERVEASARAAGADVRTGNPSPGNVRGGLTTLEEKSLGCVRKGGTTPVREFLGYGERPTRRGLVLMDTPGHDVESISGLVAGGAHLILFTTGRGTPVGCPIVPVVKVASNSALYCRQETDMDLNAGVIVDGEASVEDFGQEIHDFARQVIEGRRTAAEQLGAEEFSINRIGPTV